MKSSVLLIKINAPTKVKDSFNNNSILLNYCTGKKKKDTCVDLIKRIMTQKDGGKLVIFQEGFPMWHAIPRSLCWFKTL